MLLVLLIVLALFKTSSTYVFVSTAALGTTVTLHVAVLLPELDVTEILATPSLIAVITPVDETVATSLLSESQVTSLFVAFAGRIV